MTDDREWERAERKALAFLNLPEIDQFAAFKRGLDLLRRRTADLAAQTHTLHRLASAALNDAHNEAHDGIGHEACHRLAVIDDLATSASKSVRDLQSKIAADTTVLALVINATPREEQA